MLSVVKLLILGFVIASGVLGGPFGGRGGVLFGMGRVIREEKLVVGGGRFFGKIRGVLKRVWVLACASAPVVFGVSGCFGDKLSEVWHELMVSLDIRVPRGGSGGWEVYSPILGRAGLYFLQSGERSVFG